MDVEKQEGREVREKWFTYVNCYVFISRQSETYKGGGVIKGC